MKISQITIAVIAFGLSLPVTAQNSVVRSVDLSVNESSTITQKIGTPTSIDSDGNETVSPVLNDNSQNDMSVTVSQDSNKPEPPKMVLDGPYIFYPESGAVDYSLRKGLLKPQVVELLMHHRLIDSMDDIQWQVSNNFMWPNSHTLSGESLDHVINAVLAPYELVAEFKGNGSVLIKKL